MFRGRNLLNVALFLFVYLQIGVGNNAVEAANIEIRMWGGFRDKVIIGSDLIVVERARPGIHVVLPAFRLLPPPPPPHHHMRHPKPPVFRRDIAPPPPHKPPHDGRFMKPDHRPDKFKEDRRPIKKFDKFEKKRFEKPPFNSEKRPPVRKFDRVDKKRFDKPPVRDIKKPPMNINGKVRPPAPTKRIDSYVNRKQPSNIKPPMPKPRPNIKPAPRPARKVDVYKPMPQKKPDFQRSNGGMGRGGFGHKPRR